MPPPPPPRPPYAQLPEKCALFGQNPQCYDPSGAYKMIHVFLNETVDNGGDERFIRNASSLGKCCAACTAVSRRHHRRHRHRRHSLL